MTRIDSLRAGDPPRIGGYELAGRIGEGGQGSVFLATAPSGDQVAIKLLGSALTGGDDDPGPGFARESEILRRVAPFCTAQVIESGLLEDRPYIVSEYIDGPTLQQVVEGEGPLEGARLRRLAVGTLTALTAIHRAGVVHRDFKPSNVLLGRDGPRVIDFGIARALDAVATGSGVVGTPPYMAPEQLEGAQVEPPADLFAWGSTMVFAATGRPPFGMDSLPAIVNRILHRDPDLGLLRGDLRDLVAECLSKDAARRPTAGEALMRLLGARDRPVGFLLSAGSAAASGSPAPPHIPDSGDAPALSPGASRPPPGAGARSRARRRAAILGAGVTVALASGALVHALTRDGAPARPEATGPARPLPEVTSVPPPATTELRLPGLGTTLHENPGDTARMVSFMYDSKGGSNHYARVRGTNRFEAVAPWQEPLPSPDGTWLALLPWLKESTPQPYDFVRLVHVPSGREYIVRLTDKPLQNFNPAWSPDGTRLLLTTFDLSSGSRTPVGFAIVDAAAAKATLVRADTSGAPAAAPFAWSPGEPAVALPFGAGPRAGLRFFDLNGRTLRTADGVGEAAASESPFAPAGKRFATGCPGAFASVCVWDTATGRALARFRVPAQSAFIGWYNDAHVLLTDKSADPHKVVVMDMKGEVLRVLAEIPREEPGENRGTFLFHYMRWS
ncbi:protein kinase [Sphaerisporangium sp. NPDC051011]|uniref:protein kinase domain-containing protein n=1 Tax=Sphaerisporangium sp. NPDC051011 TaxID=3155792 RepID=UPI0033CD2FE1